MSNYRHIAIEGNIGAGKTTIAQMLSGNLQADLILESFENNPFLDQFYRSKKDIAFQLEMFFLAERYHQMSKHLLGDIFTEYIVADYFFSKSSIFGGINLEEAEHELFDNLYRIMERFMPVPDIIIYLHQPMDVIINHISNRGRSMETNISVEYLESVEQAYFEHFKTERRMPVLIFDLSEKNHWTPQELTAKIHDHLSENWTNGVHYV